MNGWMDGQIDDWMCMDGWIDDWMDGWMNGLTMD